MTRFSVRDVGGVWDAEVQNSQKWSIYLAHNVKLSRSWEQQNVARWYRNLFSFFLKRKGKTMRIRRIKAARRKESFLCQDQKTHCQRGCRVYWWEHCSLCKFWQNPSSINRLRCARSGVVANHKGLTEYVQTWLRQKLRKIFKMEDWTKDTSISWVASGKVINHSKKTESSQLSSKLYAWCQ